ncbi:phage antirepressor KilAC domain-containing protein [Jeotgalibaca porci]|uniref:phage antirepressor KilAC domain-containing protein n=1 Tax=Jeotgalibaca porci TaxID=1868793 RepID=UPI00359FD3F5
MNEINLFNLQEKEDGSVAVSGRELHQFLEIGTSYAKWFERMTEYGLEENTDYIVTDIFVPNSKGGKQIQINHALTIDTAKEISMIQRNEKGKQARQYFIKVEKAWNSPEMIMKRALQIADRKVIDLQEQIALDKPKVIFADAVSASHTSILVGELSKLLRQNGVEIGQNRLFSWLRENGFLIRRKGTDFNMPTQKSIDLELFEIKERTINNADGSIRTTRTPKVTGKGQQYFINKFLKELEIVSGV